MSYFPPPHHPWIKGTKAKYINAKKYNYSTEIVTIDGVKLSSSNEILGYYVTEKEYKNLWIPYKSLEFLTVQFYIK